MAIIKRHEPEPPETPKTISGDVDDWIRQFVRHLELHFLDASDNLPSGAGISDLHVATARAILETFIDSGMESQAVLELLGRVALEGRSSEVAWSDALNRRRFALIDKEIQGTVTAAERIELAGLTRVMREHVESETNLPMRGARALHQKLVQLEPTVEPE